MMSKNKPSQQIDCGFAVRNAARIIADKITKHLYTNTSKYLKSWKDTLKTPIL